MPGLAGAWTFDQTLGIWRDYPAPSPQAPQAKAKGPQPTPAAPHVPTNVEVLNKAINPGASDPNVPLPRLDLADGVASEPASGNAPHIYGRREEGGGVLGLTMPIPADRNASGATTRYSVDQIGLETAPATR
jgi:hypothetical protein